MKAKVMLILGAALLASAAGTATVAQYLREQGQGDVATYLMLAVAADGILGVVFLLVGLRRLGESSAPKLPPVPIHTLVERLQTEAPAAAQKLGSHPSMTAILEQLQNGRKIEAIKSIREVTGGGLKDAKELAETIERILRKPG